MALIDQRILIPVPMQVVWQYIADYTQLSHWRTDVASVSILTTRHDVAGARRRIRLKNQPKDIIEEIRVWYDGLGYEYHIIDGSRFKTYVSRLRLQATPDGTIVQWTISFEVKGIVARIWGGRRQRHSIEQVTADSLRQLRRQLEKVGVKIDDVYREKVRVREAPDVNSRAEYGAKLIAQTELAAQTPEVKSGGIVIDEPPIRLEDTPSVPRVVPPSFLAEAFKTGETPIETDVQEDTRPTKPVILEGKDSASTDLQATLSDTKPKRPPELDQAIAEPSIVEEKDIPHRSDLPAPTGKRDTGEISIWEVFGMNRPKDELATIIDELKTPEVAEPANDETEKRSTLDEWLAADEPPLPSSATGTISSVVRPPQKTKMGLRKRQRQRRLHVRRPRRPE